MDAAERFQGFTRRTHAAFLHVLKALADSLKRVGLSRDVEEALIGFGILHDRFRFAVNGKNQRPLGFLEMLHEFSGIAPECGHRLNVFLNVEHTYPVLA
jgi:hypothetical protein